MILITLVMIRAVLIDDEDAALEVLSKLLKDFVTIPVKILGKAKNLEDGIKIINSTKPDLVFLDIDMPGKSGVAIYDYFNKPEFKVIFVTAYNQFAIEALKNSAIDYILKPVDFVELHNAIQKVSEEINREQRIKELEDKVNFVCTPDMDGRNIMLEVDKGFVVENSKNIEYCHAEKAYSVIVTFIGKKTLVSKSLKELQEQLPSNQFIRTHKSFLVNIHYIRKFIRANDSFVLLRSGARIPVSIRTSKEITKALKDLFKS